MVGHVKYFDLVKRCGHIVPEGEHVNDKAVQVFFHETDIEVGSKIPEKGAEVEYELVPHCPWIRALWVRPLNKRSYAPVSEFPKSGGGTKKGGTHGD
jgi:hypothetical protein